MVAQNVAENIIKSIEMKIQINGQIVNFPSSLSEITLGQKIEFEKEHRAALDEIIHGIAKQKDPDLQEVEAFNYRHEKMIREFSFFTGMPVKVLRETENEILDSIANIYYSCLATITDDEQDIELNPQTEFVFNGEFWVLLPLDDDKSFKAFHTVKKLTKLMVDLSNGDWSALLPICATYIRKIDEPFQPVFMEEGSDRVELMKGLPMDITLHVVKYLNLTMSVYMPKTNAEKN